MNALLFAAGLGSRLRPLTDHLPKALVPVAGRPLVDRALDRLRQAGVRRVVVNAYHEADQLIAHLRARDYGMEVSVSDERPQLLDTGGGLRLAAERFPDVFADEPVLLHNVDILSNADLAAFHAAHLADDAALLVSARTTSRYFLVDADDRLVGWTNVATGEVRSPYPTLDMSGLRRLAFSGIHCFSPRLLPLMQGWPARFSIVDFYLSVCHQVRIVAHESPSLRLLDVGKPEALARAEAFLAEG